jgi:hypothetical protein
MLPRKKEQELATHGREARAPGSWCPGRCAAAVIQQALCQGLKAEEQSERWEGRGNEESAKETLQLSPWDCLECNVPLHPLPFHVAIFFTGRTQWRTYSRLQSSLLTLTTQTSEEIREKNKRQFFFFFSSRDFRD